MSWTILTPSNVAAEPAAAFSEQDIDFCHALSQSIMGDTDCRDYPELIALGFWLRRSNIIELLAPYKESDSLYKPLGRVFHAAPANVDSLFVYSGVLSLLCGNANVIRLSRRSRGSSDILIDKLTQLSNAYPKQLARFQLVQCDYDAPELSAYIANTDARVLWGSDKAIQAQRRYTMPAKARELCFSHKYSMALLSANAVNAAFASDFSELLQLFSRDNLTFSQQACSSAKTLLWLGEPAEIARAQQRFWAGLTQLLNTKPMLNASEHYQALANSQLLAMTDSAIDSIVCQAPLMRMNCHALTLEQVRLHSGCGMFLEMMLTDLAELNAILLPEIQTLTYWGLDKELLHSWFSTQLTGVDRLVPLGNALTFSVVWDGVDLIESFSRQIKLD
jgi:hypothetical protein